MTRDFHFNCPADRYRTPTPVSMQCSSQALRGGRVASMLGSATAVTVLVRDVHSEETPFAGLPLGIRPLTAKVAGVA